MKLNRLHFHPINGRALDIITAILHTEEVASVGKAFDVIRLVAEGGDDYLDVEIERDDNHITLRFRDGGVPFNPLELDSPDISLPIEQRRIGGLGFFIVTKKMDSVKYEYIDGENVLTVMKELK